MQFRSLYEDWMRLFRLWPFTNKYLKSVDTEKLTIPISYLNFLSIPIQTDTDNPQKNPKCSRLNEGLDGTLVSFNCQFHAA